MGYSYEEEFKSENGKVTELVAVKVEHRFENNKMVTKKYQTQHFIKADLVLLAMGLLAPLLRMHYSLKLKKDSEQISMLLTRHSKHKIRSSTGDCRRGHPCCLGY